MQACLAAGCGARASADGPGRDFKRLAEKTFISPDRQVRVEQYSRKSGDYDVVHRFWTFRAVKTPGPDRE
jgi:hypothetical protein